MKNYPRHNWYTFLTSRIIIIWLAALVLLCTVVGCAAIGDGPISQQATDPVAVVQPPAELPHWSAERAPVGKLQVSTNQRYLVDQQGQPFFWLGDTAWELLRRLDRAETERYLQDRAQKGFTVIQAAVVSPLSGWTKPNAAGDPPFLGDVTRPNEAYFAHVDHVVQQTAELGLIMALLPAWSDHASSNRSLLAEGENAYEYGRFLGQRYAAQDNIVWVVGGDTDPQDTLQVWRDLARGLDETSDHLITFHPIGNATSATWFHEDPWLDFNMLQSGHGWDNKNYEVVLADYERLPTKPIIDAEPRYENINEIARLGQRRIDAQQVRKAAYNALLSGAFGHTYGANEIWQFYMQNGEDGYGGEGLYGATIHWTEALDLAGAWQMSHMRTLFERYPWHEFEPVHQLVRSGSSAGGDFVPAAVSTKSESVIIYIPQGQTIELNINVPSLIERAEWFDPRTGEFLSVPKEMIQANRFMPPAASDDLGATDYVLVLKTSLSATGKNAPIPNK